MQSINGTITPLVLVVDDEHAMRKTLHELISSEGYFVVEASSGTDALAQVAANNPDLVVLDLGLPDLDGLEVTRRLRDWTSTPIIVLSARDRPNDKVAVLDAGADDYLTKPFSVPELHARVRVALRHRFRNDRSTGVIETGQLRIDFRSRIVTLAGREVRLTPVEYKLLATLARNAGRLMTYQELLKHVWGIRSEAHKQYLHVYVGHLRSKLEGDRLRPRVLLTEPGVGYRFVPDPSGGKDPTGG